MNRIDSFSGEYREPFFPFIDVNLTAIQIGCSICLIDSNKNECINISTVA